MDPRTSQRTIEAPRDERGLGPGGGSAPDRLRGRIAMGAACTGAVALGILAAADAPLAGAWRAAIAAGLVVVVLGALGVAAWSHAADSARQGAIGTPIRPVRAGASDGSVQQRLEQSEELLRAAFETAPIGIAVESTDGRFLSVNPALCRMLGYTDDELRRMTFPQVTHPGDRSADLVLMHRLLGGEVNSGEVRKRYRRKDGRWVWVDVAVSLVRDRAGAPYRFVIQARDVTRARQTEARLRVQRERFKGIIALRKRMLARERALLSELNHRVRNNLAALLGLISIYEKEGRGASSIAASLREKIHAMKSVHDAVTDGRGGAIRLSDLLGRLNPDTGNSTPGPRVRMSGPETMVPPSQSGAFAMIIQELFTNSLKHGALASEDGFIDITWETGITAGADMLHFRWEEHAPMDLEPRRDTGVGLTLIRGLCASELRGRGAFEFRTRGLSCHIEARLAPPEPTTNHAVPSKELVS